jgi:hypothetical protein
MNTEDDNINYIREELQVKAKMKMLFKEKAKPCGSAEVNSWNRRLVRIFMFRSNEPPAREFSPDQLASCILLFSRN